MNEQQEIDLKLLASELANELVQQIDERFAKLQEDNVIQVPLDQQLWTAKQVRKYFDISHDVFKNQLQNSLGFPKPQSFGDVKRPRWRAKDIIAYGLTLPKKTGRTRKQVV